MKIYGKTGVALAALSLLGAATLARADDSYHWTGALAADDLYNWPLRASAEKRPADRAEKTIYVPTGAPAGTAERAAEDAFFYRHLGGVPG